ncbi:MAG TPA: hypothetical protein VHE80_06810, partial [Acidimicrobiales bacterium]|nr:hypothetical protein [Acidimicrobiales bacterium]
GRPPPPWRTPPLPGRRGSPSTAGEVARARGFLTAAETVVPAFWRQGGWYAALDEARAHLALAEDDRAGARALLARATSGFEQCGQRLDAARCLAQATAVELGAGKVSGRSGL